MDNHEYTLHTIYAGAAIEVRNLTASMLESIQKNWISPQDLPQLLTSKVLSATHTQSISKELPLILVKQNPVAKHAHQHTQGITHAQLVQTVQVPEAIIQHIFVNNNNNNCNNNNCNLQPATYNLQPTTCNLQPATCKRRWIYVSGCKFI